MTWVIGALALTAEPADQVDTQALDALIRRAKEGTRDAVMGETRSVVIVHRGRIVREWYADGFGPDTKQVSWSMAKSITSALVGRAMELGLLDSLDDAMPTPFPSDDPRGEISWRHWLTMTDGLDALEIEAGSLTASDAVQMMFGRGRQDVAQYAVEELDVAHPPGKVWNYSTPGFNLLGWAVQHTVGPDDRCAVRAEPPLSCPPAARWMNAQLFAPIGAEIQPEFSADGTFLGGALAWASARDYARFGYLYLRDGEWDGTRLLPEGWVDFARTRGPGANYNIYGAGFWVTAHGEVPSREGYVVDPPWDSFHASGNEGQTIWIVPSRDLVIVRTGLMDNATTNWSALYAWNQSVARAFPQTGTEADRPGDPGAP